MSGALDETRRDLGADPQSWPAALAHARALARAGRLEEAYLFLFDRGGLERGDALTREIGARAVARQGEVVAALEPADHFVFAAEYWPVTPRYGPKLWKLRLAARFRDSPLPALTIERARGDRRAPLSADLAAFRCLRNLSLAGPYRRPWSAARLRLPGSLVSLSLQTCKRLPADRLQALRGARSLESLGLRAVALDDDDLEAIAGLPALGVLDLADTPVTEAGVSMLGELPALRELYLGGSAVQGAGLARFEALTLLELTGCPLTDSGLGAIAELPELRSLILRGCRELSAASFEALARLESLASLDLSDTAIDDAGLAACAALPALESLSLGGAEVSAGGLRQLAAAPSLRRLTLDGEHADKAELRELLHGVDIYWSM